MKELQVFRGHKREVSGWFLLISFVFDSDLYHFSFLISVVAWHPVYETLIASGGHDGSIFFWLAGFDEFSLIFIAFICFLFLFFPFALLVFFSFAFLVFFLACFLSCYGKDPEITLP